MAFELDKVNKLFKNYYSDIVDLYMNPDRKEELEAYKRQMIVDMKIRELRDAERQDKIRVLPKLNKGKYKIKLLKRMYDYTIKLGDIGDIVEVYNAGPSKRRGSMNANQDDRALVFDYGMSGVDNYYPTVDFEIVEKL